MSFLWSAAVERAMVLWCLASFLAFNVASTRDWFFFFRNDTSFSLQPSSFFAMVSSSCFLLSCLAKLAVVGLRAALWPGVGCWGGVGGGTSGTSVVTESSCDDAGGAHCRFFMDLVCFLFFFGSTRCQVFLGGSGGPLEESFWGSWVSCWSSISCVKNGRVRKSRVMQQDKNAAFFYSYLFQSHKWTEILLLNAVGSAWGAYFNVISLLQLLLCITEIIVS